MTTDSNTNDAKSSSWTFSIEGPFAIVLSLIGIGGIAYAIYTRGAFDFLPSPILISSALACILFSLLSPSPGTTKKSFRTVWGSFKTLIVLWALSALACLMLFGFGVSLFDVCEHLWGVMTYEGRFSLIVGFITFLAGAVFFWMRTKWRVTYGISEAFAGVAIASHRAYGDTTLWTTNDFGFYAAVLTAGVYLVVRGLDNVNQGRDLHRDPVMRIANWIKAQTFTTDPEEVRKMYGEPSAESTEKS
ncbi:hypothetical protein ACDZ94_02595 [Pseudomonas sp. UBT]|uniref:hypothetical protein n=1 Tax=Pseudomonas sp. UBT TaxID=3239198 RepID=UPI003D8016C5